MTVDTAAMRELADAIELYHFPSDLLRSAADEIDELRERVRHLEQSLFEAGRITGEEMRAHTETKRELKEEKQRRESAEAALRTMPHLTATIDHFARFGGGNG